MPGSIQGSIEIPGSKSIFQRVALMTMFNNGSDVKINNCSLCEDDLATIAFLIESGLQVFVLKNNVYIAKGKTLKYPKQINVKESGLLARFLSAILLLDEKEHLITGIGTIFKRDMSFVKDSIEAIDCNIRTNGRIPFSVKGPLKAGNYFLDGSKSSQFISGLILALTQVEGRSTIYTKNLKSRPYLNLTIELLRDFGAKINHNDLEKIDIDGKVDLKVNDYDVEGDWSSATNIITAALISGEVEIKGLDKNSIQADKIILDLLDKMNIKYEIENSFKIQKQDYQGFEFDATHTPDLLPILTVLALNAKSESKIKGISRPEIKETNRKDVLIKEYQKLGIEIFEEDDSFVIKPQKIKGGNVNSYSDHRIAMCFSVAALAAENSISIQDSQAVMKSYPSFYYHLEELGATIVE